MITDALFQEEEAKRIRNWDPAQRRQAMLDFLTWAEAQQAVPRNSKESCLARQAEHDRRAAEGK